MWARHVIERLSDDAGVEPVAAAVEPARIAAAPAPPSAPARAALPSLSGHVVVRSDTSDEYRRARRNYNARLDLHPAVIVYCYGEADVVNAVNYGIATGLQICMRSGSHDYEGFSLNDDGIVIDTSRLDRVSVSHDRTTAVVGPGTPLRTLYHVLGDHGTTLPGGSCGTVGVAGLVTGGGFGLLSRKYGMFCDKLVRVRMVDGTGTVREATRHHDPDGLFWATCGGGGGNFGVVTELEFALVPVTERVTTFSYHWAANDETARELVARFTRWEPSREMFATAVFQAGGGVMAFAGQRFGDEAATRAELVPILNGGRPLPPPVKTPAFASMTVLEAAEAGGGDDAQEERFKMASSLGRGELSAAGIDALIARTHAAVPKGALWFAQFDTFGGAIADRARDATAFVHRDLTYTVQYQTYWKDPAETEPSETWLRDTFDAIDPHIGRNASYRNYCDLDLTDWEARYYGENAPRLRRVKKRFDPNNVFHYPQSISPA
jgi:FAD/FMN-containing dehydrogenase